MSDGKEVKRWSLSQLDSLSSNSWTNATFVSSVDHDRIVAELRAEVERVKRFEAALEDAVIKYRETIATQTRVIEKLKERLTSWISETHPNDEHLRNMCLMVEERELEAIEKEGAKDD